MVSVYIFGIFGISDKLVLLIYTMPLLKMHAFVSYNLFTQNQVKSEKGKVR